MNLVPYLKLIRLNKPIGTLLLWYPTAWALWLASHGKPSPLLVFYFLIGTIVMRSAGCVINDIADRQIDLHVTRTKNRPIASGEITLPSAIGLLAGFLFIACMILTQLPAACFSYGIFSVVISTIYPFCKRFLKAPQLILGIAFSMGIPMAFIAESGSLNFVTLLLFILNFCWIVAYDTIYAMADKKDDLDIGIQSTAILFGKQDKNIVMIFQAMTQLLWLIIALILHMRLDFYGFWLTGLLIFLQQQRMIRKPDANYIQTFSSNGLYGLVFWLALVLQSLN